MAKDKTSSIWATATTAPARWLAPNTSLRNVSKSKSARRGSGFAK